MKITLTLVALVAFALFVLPFLKRLIVMLFLRTAVRGALQDVGAKALANMPDRIALVHQNLHSWRPDPAVARLADPLFTKGFQEGGLFAIREMPGVTVRFLVKPSACVVAAIFMHPRAGVWLDLVTYYQNGNTATFSSNQNHGLDQRPGHPIVYAYDAPALTLFTRMSSERPKGVFRPIMAEDLVTLFERSYADSMTWRKNKGIRAAEVVKVAQRKVS